MKKEYIIPTTTTVAVNVVSTILEGSLQEINTTVSGNRGGWVKEDRGSRGDRSENYNVWNDDWSN